MSIDITNKRTHPLYELKRHPYEYGLDDKLKPYVNIQNKRTGVGNNRLIRPAFKMDDPAPRNVSFDAINAIDLHNLGTKVHLSDKTLSELVDIHMPDPEDYTWLNEKKRMVEKYKRQGMTDYMIEKELEFNKPLGREQRKIHQRRNIAQVEMTFSSKLKELREEIMEGRVESQEKQGQIIGQMANIMDNTNDIKELKPVDTEALRRLNIPQKHTDYGLPRLVGKSFYKEKTGLINLLLISNALAVGKDPNKPVYNADTDNWISLRSMQGQKNLESKDDPKFLDLESGQMISGEMANQVGIELPEEMLGLSEAEKVYLGLIQPEPRGGPA